MDANQLAWGLGQKVAKYAFDNADKINEFVNDGPDDSPEFEEWVDKDAVFTEELARDIQEMLDQAREEERAKLREWTKGSSN